MKISSQYIDKEIFGILSGDSEISLHSQFENSLNVKLNGIILNIGTNLNVLPPYGMILSILDFARLKEELESEKIQIHYESGSLVINKLRMQLDSAEEYSSCLERLDGINIKSSPRDSLGLFPGDGPIHFSVDNVITTLKASILATGKGNGWDIPTEDFLLALKEEGLKEDKSGLFVDKNPGKLSYNTGEAELRDREKSITLNKLQELPKSIKSKDPIKIQEAARYFLGRGKGLTPAGDDFIVGVLAVFHACSIHEEFILIIQNLLEEKPGYYTNDISEQFLIQGTRGRFSRNIIELISMIHRQEYDSKTVTNLIGYGNTSGIDTVMGILFAYTIIQQEKK